MRRLLVAALLLVVLLVLLSADDASSYRRGRRWARRPVIRRTRYSVRRTIRVLRRPIVRRFVARRPSRVRKVRRRLVRILTRRTRPRRYSTSFSGSIALVRIPSVRVYILPLDESIHTSMRYVYATSNCSIIICLKANTVKVESFSGIIFIISPNRRLGIEQF